MSSKKPILTLILAALLLAAGASEGASDSREVVSAGEILAKIEQGELVEYEGVIVEGDWNLSELGLPTEHVDRTAYESRVLGLAEETWSVESAINITNSEIRGEVTSSNTIFQKPIDFGNTEFSGRAHFRGAR
ncbi:MAG TPA: hypothetical protein PLS83_12925, partial [Methanothrix soehngenii]|nr:hypothetical protein [Methanothrix soehngenii]